MKFQIPLFPYFPLFCGLIFGLMGYGMMTAHALTPKERELVQGLNGINAELRAKIAAQDAQLEQAQTAAMFAAQKNESLSARLAESKMLEGDQAFELGLQQAKIRDQAAALDAQTKRADKNEKEALKFKREAHVKSVVIDITLGVISIAITVLVGMCSGQILGWLAKMWPASAAFGALIEIGLLVGTPIIIFGFLKGLLAVVESRL